MGANSAKQVAITVPQYDGYTPLFASPADSGSWAWSWVTCALTSQTSCNCVVNSYGYSQEIEGRVIAYAIYVRN